MPTLRFFEQTQLDISDDKRDDQSSTLIRWLFRCLAVALGLAQIVAARNTVGPDARSYLEIARAILRHDWSMAVNAYWSPLYSWLLAACLGMVKPTLRWEFPAAHALAFPVLLGCMAAFEFFWAAILRLRERTTCTLGLTSPPIPSTQMWVLGYSLFIWMTVGDLITAINPDLCMTTMILLAAGLLIRIQIAADARRSLYLWFGVCLGVGYMVKAVLFPVAFIFLGMMMAVSARPVRKNYFALAAAIFMLIASVQITLLSRSKGRLTFSDTGKLAYAWYNYDLPVQNWQGEPPGSGVPVHPTRKIYDQPAIYEFNGPLRSSYPPWYDPSYWNEGLSPAFRFAIVAKHALSGAYEVGMILLQPTAWALGIMLIILGSEFNETFKGIGAGWYLLFTSAIVFAMHCLTLVQSRYLAPWEILLWGAILAGVRLRRRTARWYWGVTAVVSLALVGAIAHLIYGESVHGFHNDASAEYVTAEGLQRMGLQPGTKVGAIGFDNDAYWAYLARFDIVAEIDTDETCLFWSESAAIQMKILEKFDQAGASIVVANTGGGVRTTSRAVPLDLAGCSRPSSGWRKIDGSPNYAYFLK